MSHYLHIMSFEESATRIDHILLFLFIGKRAVFDGNRSSLLEIYSKLFVSCRSAERCMAGRLQSRVRLSLDAADP